MAENGKSCGGRRGRALRLSKDTEDKLIEFVRDWLRNAEDMADLMGDRLWNLNDASDEIPVWVRSAAARLSKTYFHQPAHVLSVLDLTPYRMGYLLGLMQFSTRQITSVEEKNVRSNQNIWRRMSAGGRKKLSAEWEQFLIRADIMDSGKNIYFPKPVLKWEKDMKKRSLEDQREFHRGIGDGLAGYGEGTEFDRSTQATTLLIPMVVFWRMVSRFDSMTVLHQWLCKVLGPQIVGEDKKRIENLCRRLGGPKFRGVGRPQKIPSPV